MAASMYIVVEGEDPGFDIFVNGRALARNEDALERLAVNIGARPLIEFFSADENSMALLIEEVRAIRHCCTVCRHHSGIQRVWAWRRCLRCWRSFAGNPPNLAATAP